MVVKPFVDLRLIITVGVMLLIVRLAVVFVYSARSVRKEHKTRFNRIQRQLERDAAALLDRLLRRD